jgi:hypothetical protein
VQAIFCDASVAESTRYVAVLYPSLLLSVRDSKIYDNIICWNKQYGNIPAGTAWGDIFADV